MSLFFPMEPLVKLHKQAPFKGPPTLSVFSPGFINRKSTWLLRIPRNFVSIVKRKVKKKDRLGGEDNPSI